MSMILPYDIHWDPKEKVEQPEGKLLMVFITELEKDVTLCQALHRDVKARLHAGEISSKTAQGKISSLLARKAEKRKEISRLRYSFSEKIKEIDPKITLRAVDRILAHPND